VRYVSEASIGSLSAEHFIGVLTDGNDLITASGIAVFAPAEGDNTTGNVVVDNSGTKTEGSLSYPAITDHNDYVVLIDHAGHYLNAGETGFYTGGADPRKGDSPDVTLSAVPSGANRFPGIWYESAGNSQGANANYLEVAIRP